jgi:uncharacterized membrane protein YfcA
MFFVGIVIATIAMSAGIGGATFFVPFFLLVLKIPVRSAIVIGIFIEIFGFAAGFYNYRRMKQIDFPLAWKTLFVALPSVVVGVVLNRVINPTVGEVIFILALMIIATQFLLLRGGGDGEPRQFDFISMLIAAFGGLLLGFISTGLGESNEYSFFSRLKRSPPITAGTSVLVVAISAIVATTAQIIFLLLGSGLGTIAPYVALIVYSVLGVLVGAKLGSIVSNRVEKEPFRRWLSVVLYVVAIVSILRIVFVGP